VTDATWKKIESKIIYYAESLCKEYNKNEPQNKPLISFNEKKMERVFEVYKEYNRIIHSFMLNNEAKPTNFEIPNTELSDRIDRHKVASAFLASIIEAQPMQINTTENVSVNLRTANESLSFAIGCHIITSFVNTKNICANKILSPKCCCEDREDYRMHFVKIVYRLKSLFRQKNFDAAVLFFVSHVFFLLEQCSIEKQ